MTKRLLLLAGALACSETPESPVVHFSRPLDVAVVCLGEDSGLPLERCNGKGGTSLMAYVLNGETGSITRVGLSATDPTFAVVVDDDGFTPGYTPTIVGTAPVALTASPGGEWLFLTDSATPAVTRINAKTLDVVVQALPSAPAGLVVSDDTVYVALPDAAAVARIPFAEFGNVVDVQRIELPGSSPYDLALTSYGTLWVSNADVAWVAAVQPETGAELARVSAAPTCRDDLDNDGDGVFDWGDGGCRRDPKGSETGEASPPGPSRPWPGDTPAPSCFDGVDDDGDGATDYPADPQCLSATGEEAPRRAPVLSRIALSPDERFLYVTNARERTVEVIDVDVSEHVRVHDGANGNALYASLGRTGVGLPGVPVDVTFVQEDDLVMAVVTAVNGNLFFVRAEDSAGVQHRLDASDTAQTSGVFLPTLSRFLFRASGSFLMAGYSPGLGGLEALSLGGDRRPDYPSFGNFAIVRDLTTSTVLSWYGIEVVGDDKALAPNEFWTVTHADVVLDRRTQGWLFKSAAERFESFDRPYCTAGVEVGDWLVVETATLEGCPSEYAEGAMAWEIASVSANGVTVVPNSGRVIAISGTDVGGDGVVLPSTFKSAGPPNSCLDGQPLNYVVQAAPGQYVVRGGTSGVQHPWIEDDVGACVMDPNAPATQRSRVREWTLKSGATLDRCPISDEAADASFEGERFENHAVRFRVLPGCRRDSKTGISSLLETPWLARWSFQTRASTNVRLASSTFSGLPRGLSQRAPNGLLYYVDPASNQLFGIEGTTGTVRLRTN